MAEQISKDYAVVEAGGRQCHVSPGQRVRVDKLPGAVGDKVTLEKVLIVKTGDTDAKIGAPTVAGAKVEAKIVAQTKDAKVIVYKKIRRKGYTKKQGHRQAKTELLIESING